MRKDASRQKGQNLPSVVVTGGVYPLKTFGLVRETIRWGNHPGLVAGWIDGWIPERRSG